MKTLKRINKTVWIVLVILLVIQILFDPLSPLVYWSKNFQARVRLSPSRHKWESQGITHYKFDIRGYVPLVCIFGGSVEVKDEEVIHTGPSSDVISQADPFLDMGFRRMENPFLCNYQNYTITKLFDEIERYKKESPSIISGISFDPKYGFISGFGFGSSGGKGLLSPRISDCCGGFSIRNFHVLDE